MIITCPHCRTRYQVALEALGAAGRSVQCAACNEAWTATPVFPEADGPADPEPDADELAFAADRDDQFPPGDEALLDQAFERAEARAAPSLAATAPPSGLAEPRAADRRGQALTRRRRALARSLPLARLRRLARLAVALALVLVIAGALVWRTEIVRAFPELDRLYRAVGLGTNVVGLDFAEVGTVRAVRDGVEVLMVTAGIAAVTGRTTPVPPVLVTLLDGAGTPLYEWSVTPKARSIRPGDVLTVETQLTAPPPGVERVRLSFVPGQGRFDGANGTGAAP